MHGYLALSAKVRFICVISKQKALTLNKTQISSKMVSAYSRLVQLVERLPVDSKSRSRFLPVIVSMENFVDIGHRIRRGAYPRV